MKKILAYKFIRFLSQSDLIVKVSRLIVQFHDNDANCNIDSNGELRVLTYISDNYTNIFDGPRYTFFDVGANIGKYTSLLHQRFGVKNSWIYSFDPSPDNITQIKNRCLSNVTPIEAAISNYNGVADFYENSDRSSSSTDSLYDMNSIGYVTNLTARSVRVSTIDHLCKEHQIKKINFLKLDIEGNELKALLGAEQMLNQNAIDLIQFEFGHAARASRVLLKDIIDFLEKFHFEIYVIKPKHIEKVQYNPFYENRYNMGNFLAFKHASHSYFTNLII